MDQIVQESYYTPHMLEDIPVGIALLDARDFHMITANRCFRTLLSHTLMEEKHAQTLSKEQDVLNLLSAPNFPFALDLFRSVVQTGTAYQSQEFPVPHPQRGLTYWNGSITPLYDEQDRLDRLLLTASEVTEQVKARLLAESQWQEQSIDKEIQRLAAMEAVAHSVSREMVKENIARVACETLVRTLSPICIYIHFACPERQALFLAHIAIDEEHELAADLRQAIPELECVEYTSPHWIARVRQTHEPLLIPRLPDASRVLNTPTPTILADGGYICLPLWFKDSFEGSLVVLFAEALKADSLLVRILKDCSTCISAALAHSRLLNKIESERARLHAVLEHSPEGVFLVEAEHRCISYANEAAARILQIPRANIIGVPLESVYAALREQFSLTHKERAFEDRHVPLLRALAGESVIGEEVQFAREGCQPMTLLVAAAPIWNEAHIITGAVSVFQDISQRKSIEQQKSEFLSLASHELRTPTTAIQGFAEILQLFAQHDYEPGAPHTRQIIENILRQSARLTQLIDEMLDISAIEHRQLAIQPGRHDLAATVRRAVEQMAMSDYQHPIRLTFEGLAPDEALYGIFDKGRILQVLTNLISNALKYSRQEEPIEVGLRRAESRPDLAFLWVRDRGIGIPAAEIPSIFERFHRAANFDRSISGLGLGLYLAREIIVRHGGTLQVTSQEGIGSTFWLELPLTALDLQGQLSHKYDHEKDNRK